MDSIQEILTHNKLIIHLQPILSLRGRTFFGLEALVRGVDSKGETIPPSWLFTEAKKENLSIELDRQARHLSIHTFAPIWKENPKLLLFVNFESNLIDTYTPGDYLFDGLLKNLGIPYSNIVLEIKEDEILNTQRLKDFCSHYRALGFNIALDDFGIGRSSFDRLAVVRPDIIKIDRSLIENIDQNYIHQEIVQAICNMSKNIGALTLAEGVETLEEAVYCKHLGATLVQGFWFAKPSLDPSSDDFLLKTDRVKTHCRKMMDKKHLDYEEVRTRAESLCQKFTDTLHHLGDISQWTSYFGKKLENYPDAEALYLINSDAKQIGSTLLRCNTRSFFEPTMEGCDHSYKEYYLRARESSHGFYLTNSYLSLASGNTCCTYARTLSIKDELFVLCIDFTQ